MDIVNQKLALVKRFVDIRKLFERGDNQAGISVKNILFFKSDYINICFWKKNNE